MQLGDMAPEGKREETLKELSEATNAYETFLEEVKLSNAELASFFRMLIRPRFG